MTACMRGFCPVSSARRWRCYRAGIRALHQRRAHRAFRRRRRRADGAGYRRVARHGGHGLQEDVDRAVGAARAALEGDWGRTPPTERSRLLHALADAIQANRKELAELEARNVGKAISSVKAELNQGSRTSASTPRQLRRSPAARTRWEARSSSTRLKEPVGVAGQIVPWNYPLTMTTWKLAPALAAGCSIVLKPDSQTPLTRSRMAELATEVGFPPGAINVVPGDGKDGRRAPRPAPGRRQGRVHGLDRDGRRDHAARLGLDQAPDARARRQEPEPRLRRREPRRAVPAAVWSIYYSAGQSCEARSRVLVEQSLYDEFVAAFSDRAQALKVGDPLEAETQMGSLSRKSIARVHGFVESGVEEGAEVVTGGDRCDGEGAFYPPTVLGEDRQLDDGRAGGDLRAGRDRDPVRGREGRGPARERRALRPDGDRLDGRSRRGHRLAARIKAGTVGINMPFTAFPGIPFGGYKQSGFGRELGLETLDRTSRRRASSSRRARGRSTRSAYRAFWPIAGWCWPRGRRRGACSPSSGRR